MVTKKKINRYHLISDFNVDPLKGCIANIDKNSKITSSPYGQVYQSIYKTKSNLDMNSIIWTRPQNVLPSFLDVFNFKKYNQITITLIITL